MTIYDFDKIDMIAAADDALNLFIVDPANLVDKDRFYALKRKLKVYRAALEDSGFRSEHANWKNAVIKIIVAADPTKEMQQAKSISFKVDGEAYKVPISYEFKESPYGGGDDRMHLIDVDYNYKTISDSVVNMAKEHIKMEAFTPFGLTWNSEGKSSVMDVSFFEGDQQLPAAKQGVRDSIAKDESVQAAAVAYDVLAIHPDQTEKTDAIAIDLEHRLGSPLRMLVHYQKKNGEVETQKPYAIRKEAELFDEVVAAVAVADDDVVGADPESSDEDSAAEMQSWLESLPNVCFILVAGIDGEIDKKETIAFGKAIQQYLEHPNPLVREVFTAATDRAEQDFKEIMEMGSSGAIMLPLRLVASRKTALEKSPEHAEEFFKVLIEMSNSIASASGGFLGFGSKISKEEKAALTVIEKMLLGETEE